MGYVRGDQAYHDRRHGRPARCEVRLLRVRRAELPHPWPPHRQGLPTG